MTKRAALVLGGSKGLGFGVARALTHRGVRVGLVARDQSALGEAAQRLKDETEAPATFTCDLFDRESVNAMLAAVERQLPPIDILVLNSGGPPPFEAADFAEQIWIRNFQAMFLSQVMIAHHLLAGMRARKFGRIVIVSSTSVREPIPALTASNSLRAALAGWAKTLAGEVVSDGVTVNLVLPGRFATERTASFDQMDAAERGVDPSVIAAESQAEIPIGRYGTPDEFGAVVSFLASEAASYVTGTALPVDGGLTRSMG